MLKIIKTHPRTDICDYYASVDKYGLGAGIYPKDKAPVPPFHPFCRCAMIPKYADEYGKAKLNANADKEYLLSLKEWQRARILGSKAKADEALKAGDISAVFNAMKPERYKVKSINEVVEFQKQSGIISALNQGQNMNIKKAFSDEEIVNIMEELINLKGIKEPSSITIDEFLKNAPFKNAQNIVKHLSSRKDSENRIDNLSYAIPTFLQSDKKIKVYELDKKKQ